MFVCCFWFVCFGGFCEVGLLGACVILLSSICSFWRQDVGIMFDTPPVIEGIVLWGLYLCCCVLRFDVVGIYFVVLG